MNTGKKRGPGKSKMKKRKSHPSKDLILLFHRRERAGKLMESGKVREKLGGRCSWAPSVVRITDEGPRHAKASTWEALTAQPAAQSRAAAREPSLRALAPPLGQLQSSAAHHSWRLSCTPLQPPSLTDQDRSPQFWLTPRASPPRSGGQA